MTCSDRLGRVAPIFGRVWQIAETRASSTFGRLVRLVLVEKLIEQRQAKTHTHHYVCFHAPVSRSFSTMPGRSTRPKPRGFWVFRDFKTRTQPGQQPGQNAV